MDTYVTVQGNLTADPVARTTAGGATVVRFRVASNTRRFDKQAGEFRDADPLYIDVSCWRTLAGNVLATVRKGDSVIVSGKLLYRSYEDANGNRQNRYEIDALGVGPDLNRCPVDIRRPARPAVAEEQTAGGEAATQVETAA